VDPQDFLELRERLHKLLLQIISLPCNHSVNHFLILQQFVEDFETRRNSVKIIRQLESVDWVIDALTRIFELSLE
jgi:hypothetical protein